MKALGFKLDLIHQSATVSLGRIIQTTLPLINEDLSDGEDINFKSDDEGSTEDGDWEKTYFQNGSVNLVLDRPPLLPSENGQSIGSETP